MTSEILLELPQTSTNRGLFIHCIHKKARLQLEYLVL